MSDSAEDILVKVANILHHGGLLGYDDIDTALADLRKLTMHYWDMEECNRLQREIK